MAQARRAVAVLLLAQGAGGAAWATRLPSIQNHLHLSAGTLGLALVGQPLGLVAAVRCAPRLVRRWSSARVGRWSAAASAGCIVTPALVPSWPTLCLALVCLGLVSGLTDIAVNVQAVAVERAYGRPVMTRLHAMWSVGLLVGSLTASLAAGAGVAPVPHLVIAAVCLAAVAAFGGVGLLESRTPEELTDRQPQDQVVAERRRNARRTLLVISSVVFCSLLVEGSVTDWSGVFLHQEQHASLGTAALGVAVYSVGALVGRLSGDAVIARTSRVSTLWRAAAVGGAGMTLAVLAPNPGLALAAYGLLGLGVSVITPIAFTAAGAVSGVTDVRALAQVTTFGYAGSFLGPALIGVVAHEIGLKHALLIPAGLLLLIVPLAGTLRRLTAPSPA